MVVNEGIEGSEVESAVFKKKLKKLKEFKGRNTELISLYVPENADRSSVMGQLTEEMSQSSNIKSPQTRKNVQGALRKINNFLKQINFKIPKHGLALFSGNISEREGSSDIRLFTVRPLKDLKVKLYWCNSEFHLQPLLEMITPSDAFAILTIDKREATIALLFGKKYEILGKFTSGVAGKARAGGQSAARFERLREEAEKEFFKRISEKMKGVLESHLEKLKGIIIAGPGITKNEFLEKEYLDYRLKEKVMGTLDVSYTDESGIREALQKSDSLLKDAEVTKERALVNGFLEKAAKNELVAYGQKEVEEVLEQGKVKTLLLSEGIEWTVVKIQCQNCNAIEDIVVKEKEQPEIAKLKCLKCSSKRFEVLEEIDYIDFMVEKAKKFGSEIKVISVETPEGEQFFKSFGGIAAFLRYK